MLPALDEILDNFRLLDEPDDRLEYLIELGRMAEPLPEAQRSEENRVRGCASQVWLETQRDPGPVLRFHGDSDAIITRGIVALIAAIYSGKPPAQILATDALSVFREIGLAEHLTAQRSNGARSMMDRILRDARAVAA